MTQRSSNHTWPIHLAYHECPKCGLILESRKGYRYCLGKYVKDLVCSRCAHTFRVERKEKIHFGPLIGEPQPPEFNWG